MAGICGKKILVLGGTGFVGSTVVSRALQHGVEVVSMSRRGCLTKDENTNQPITWVKGDASDPARVKEVVDKHGPFNGCVHALGVMFDGQSSLKNWNVYASGAKSVADGNTTYDTITRVTAFNAMDAMADQQKKQGGTDRVPFVFISAAEAGWTFNAPVDWLQRYLVAKRAVESGLVAYSDVLRPVVMRPSLVWSWSHPEKVVASLPFRLGSAIGLPFVDPPVQVDALADAILQAIRDPLEEGVKTVEDISRMASDLDR